MSPPQVDDVQTALAHFKTTPWIAAHIATSGWTPVPSRTREPKESEEDSFFATTLQTPKTMSRHLTLARADSIPLPASAIERANSATQLPIPACRTFWTLGTGLNGFPGLAHGGLSAALLDEGMGMLLTLNAEFGAGKDREPNPLIDSMTAYLKMQYKAPVPTGTEVMVESKFVRREGRKFFLESRIFNSEGKELVFGETLYIDTKKSRL